jgi:hypothetical protein
VVTGTQGIDVILEMNWIDMNQATNSYDKRTMKLISPSREEIVTKLIMPTLEEGAYHQTIVDGREANPLEAIKVVSEFSDVVPKEILGMPPQRKVEFSVELIPGTAPDL